MNARTTAVWLFISFLGLPLWSASEAVSRSPSASRSAGGSSFHPVISADGARLVFSSHANNLVTNDNQREWLDLFAHDLNTSNTVLISAIASGQGGGNGNSFAPSVSSNGQFVAFASEADDLVGGDTNRASDIFVRDLVFGATRLVSADVLGFSPLDENPYSSVPLSGHPMISTDGRWVFFESRATNLSAWPDTNNAVDVFARDLQSNTTVLVSRSLSSARAANSGSELSGIATDGPRVLFISSATDLVTGTTNGFADIFVHDLSSSTTLWVSASMTHSNGYRCVSGALSGSGRYVAFVVVPTNEAAILYLRDLVSSSTVAIATNVQPQVSPQISTDGGYVLFETGTNIFRWNATNGLTELVNQTANGMAPGDPTNGVARSARMTPDGSGVVFVSNFGGLTTNDSVGVFQVYARDMAGGVTHLLSKAANGLPGSGSEQSLVAVGPDLSRVAFDGVDASLVEGDGNRASDVFVRSIQMATTRLVSAAPAFLPRITGIGAAWVGTDSISADGRYVAFTSYDSDLVPGDTNGWSDIFIHDRVSGETLSPGISTNVARFPAISANGRYVVYSRGRPSYPWLPSLGMVFRFDRETKTNETVEILGSSARPAINADGNLIAFRSIGILYVRNMSQGTNLNLGPADSFGVDGGDQVDARFTPDSRFVLFKTDQLRAYDLWSNRTHLVSGHHPGPPASGSGYYDFLHLSGNARYLLFGSLSFGLILHDLIGETNLSVASSLRGTLSEDGGFLAFNGGDVSMLPRFFVRDLEAGIVELIPLPAGSPAFGVQINATPLISSDARFVVFSVLTSNRLSNVFVRDRLLGTTTLVSRNLSGEVGNASSAVRPVLAADGRTVVFHSMANDLVPGDYNDKRDIFVVKLRGEDTDNDGMDDDWEVAHFGNRARDGEGDFDNDGTSDRAEFLAGTDPTNTGSVFRVLTVTSLGGSGTRVLWIGNPERNYRVEFKDDVAAATWSALSGPISWTGDTASLTDTNIPVAHRFYRVVRVP